MSKQDNRGLYEQEERLIRNQSDAFVSFLTKRGLIADSSIDNERAREAKKIKLKSMYHNTRLLLRHYRNIAWMLECFPETIAEELDQPFEDLDELLDHIDLEGVLGNKKMESRLESIQKTRLLIDRVNEALTILKRKPGNGELLYKLIYVTYIQPEKLSYTAIFDELCMCERHYYRLREQAISIISIRLWAAPAKEVDYWLDILTLLDGLE